MIKKSNKYKYINGKQITDADTGKRVYEISNYRLPSVTTVLGATKNQDFIKKWKARVGEVNAEKIKNHSASTVQGAPPQTQAQGDCFISLDSDSINLYSLLIFCFVCLVYIFVRL